MCGTYINQQYSIIGFMMGKNIAVKHLCGSFSNSCITIIFRSVESNYSMICVTNICWILFDFMNGVQNFLQYSLSVVHHVQEGSTVSY